MGIRVGTRKKVNPARQAQPARKLNLPFDLSKGTYQTAGPGAVRVFARAYVESQKGDYLICTLVDNNQEILVAKPFLLRQTTYDGLSVSSVTYTYTSANTRTAVDDNGVEDDETQVITPSYLVNEELIVMKHTTGVSNNAQAVMWEDMNTAGRQWAVEPA